MVGNNCKFTLYRMWTGADDDVGGAMYSGTPMAFNWPARIEQNGVPTLLAAQGLETETTYTMMTINHPSGIFERDEVEVVTSHYLFNERLRVANVARDSIAHTQRGHVELLLKKIIRSRQRP